MLLLCDPQDNEFSLFDPLSCLIIPGRHGLTATASPGGEVDQQDFPAAKLRQRYWLMVRNTGQDKIGVYLADAGRIAFGVGWCGEKEKASKSQHQQAQISHSPVLLDKFILVDLQELI